VPQRARHLPHLSQEAAVTQTEWTERFAWHMQLLCGAPRLSAEEASHVALAEYACHRAELPEYAAQLYCARLDTTYTGAPAVARRGG
jgi:hypothetical protein